MPESGVPMSGGELDARTVFVRKLPFSLSDSQFEELFSEVGPVRHCFTVKEKGSEQHRGFGFVQFAVAEDAQKAVESKNGLMLQGCKIKVEIAKRRPSLDVRRRRQQDGNKHDEHTFGATGGNTKEKVLPIIVEDANKKRKRVDIQESRKLGQEHVKKRQKGGHMESDHLPSSPRETERSSSAKQRSARTVIVGGIGNSEVLDGVLVIAKKVGSIEKIENSITKEELNSHNLAKDGCKFPAAAIVYMSVRSAHQAVAALHQQQVNGCFLWARQLGGEGSKLKKCRLIIRNLPFQVEEASLRESFSLAGFVWEITIPRKPDGSSRGFCFIGYTSKSDADKAIKTLNESTFGKRRIAVDWAVGKKEYETFVSKLDPEHSSGNHTSEEELTEDEGDTASEDNDHSISEKETDGGDPLKDESAQKEDDISLIPHEKNIINKVLSKILTKSVEKTDVESPKGSAQTYMEDKYKHNVQTLVDFDPKKSDVNFGTVERVDKTESTAQPAVGDLEKTIFIRNLPANALVTDLRKQFSSFGIVKSLRLVLHPITRRPKGTAFLEFDSTSSAQNAISAAEGSGDGNTGLLFGGRALIVHSAVERDTARNISKQRSIEEHQDRRNLFLAKEGLIQEGTPAAEGISKSDMAKRNLLENEKATKLRSPNFHVARTRLAIHNFPKAITEKEVKKLFVEAVKSRASKQVPIIKQIKILKDGEKSRGAGFVEFSQHQHALVALRVLNNNPDVFGIEHRPIVEFAIENTLKLRERASRLAMAKTKQRNDMANKRPNELKNKLDQQLRKKDPEVVLQVTKRSENVPREKRQLHSEVSISRKKLKLHSTSKTLKIQNKLSMIPSSKPNSSNLGGSSDTNQKRRIKSTSKMENGDVKFRALPYASQSLGKVSELSTKTSRKKDRRKAPASNLEDKLDTLVMEYRSKYFSHPPGKKDPENSVMGLRRTSENIKRWFE